MLRLALVALLTTQVLFAFGAIARLELKITPQTVIFDCHSKPLEEVALPESEQIGDILFDGCAPKTSFSEFFSSKNITISNVSSIRIHNLATPLKAAHLKGLQLHLFQLKNVTLDNDFLDETAQIDTLIIDECVLPKLPENVEIENLVLKNGENVDEFGGCKIQTIDISKWKIPEKSGWLAGCKNLMGLSLNGIKENEVKLVLEDLSSLKIFQAIECDLTSLPKELNKNVNLIQLALKSNKLVKIGDAIKPFHWLKLLLVLEDSLDLEDLAQGLEALPNLVDFNVINYKGCPETVKVQATVNATEVKVGDTVELSCWIDPPSSCLHVLRWHRVPRFSIVPPNWSPSLLASSSQNKLTTYWTIKDKGDTDFLCRGLFPGRFSLADHVPINIKVVD